MPEPEPLKHLFYDIKLMTDSINIHQPEPQLAQMQGKHVAISCVICKNGSSKDYNTMTWNK